ncbi:MAG: D-alanyl-D-alanine carboxypeptidase [Clostridiales bacterium]|nr:D-alanyl-D-alanine carboxypeptidase [Clostridiales bacterium]
MQLIKYHVLPFLLSFILAISCLSTSVFAEEVLGEPELTSQSAVLMEAETGTVLMEKNPHSKLPPASVTKVMTLLLIYDAVKDGKIHWEDQVTISEHAASMGGSQVFLEPGETQTAADLTKAISIASANDGAVAMAEHIAGSEEAFVAMMNEKAKSLGMNDTTFVNACGLDVDGHVTSAYDIALMSRALLTNYPEVTQYTTTWQDSIIHHTRRGEEEFGLTNTNKLLKWYPGATGLKTGSTGKAKYCLSGSAERNGMQLIAVIMAAPDHKTRFTEDMALLDWGFANYAFADGIPQGEIVGEIPVIGGEEEIVEVQTKNPVHILTKKGNETDFETEIRLLPQLSAPVASGTKAGEVIYSSGGTEICRSDVIVTRDIEKANLWMMIGRLIRQW